MDANASLDRIEEIKLVARDPDEYLKEILDQDWQKSILSKIKKRE